MCSQKCVVRIVCLSNMERYTTAEKIKIILLYGECGQLLDLTINLYAAQFPEANKFSSRTTVHRVVNQFLNDRSVHPKKRKRKNTVTNSNNEVMVLATIAQDPQISSRTISRTSGISQRSVLRILNQHKFYPYRISLHQDLRGNDFVPRKVL